MYSGGNGTVDNPYQIANATDLYDVRENLSAYFIQTADISLTSYADWTSIGDAGTDFSGSYDGQYFTITDLVSNSWGLFKNIAGAELKNIRLSGTINSTQAQIGGLFGISKTASTISNCVVDVDITTTNATAGGFCSGSAVADTYTKCIALGNVTAHSYCGGFFGYFSANNVLSQATLSDCYAFGNVTATHRDVGKCGGFGGRVYHADISNCYSIGLVTCSAPNYVKGFIGELDWLTDITHGVNYYNSTTSGRSDIEADTGATPKTTTEMKTEGTFTSWDFDDVWIMDTEHNSGYPNLIWYYNLLLSAPTDLENYEKTTNSISVRWTASTKADGYYIYVDDVLEDDTTETEYTITGLTANTTYGIKVSAYNTEKESAKTDELEITTNAIPTQPTFQTVPPSRIAIKDINTYQDLAILDNVISANYTKRLNEIWTAEFTLPADDTKNEYCTPFAYVEIYDCGERVELFRIISSDYSDSGGIKTITYQCEHVIATLLDDIIFGWEQHNLSIRDILTLILAKQSKVKWILGTYHFGLLGNFGFENENLWSAILSVTKIIYEDFQFAYDTTTYPFVLNLIRPTDDITAEIRYQKNLIGIKKTVDNTNLATRYYALGNGEGRNQVTIASVNDGLDYIDTENVATMGVISTIFIDKSELEPSTLKQKLIAYIDKTKTAMIKYSIDASDISAITDADIDKLTNIGNMVKIYDDELGEIDDRVVSVSKSDIFNNPSEISIELSNKSAEVIDWKRINEISSRGFTTLQSDNCIMKQEEGGKWNEWEFYIPSDAKKVNKCTLYLHVVELASLWEVAGKFPKDYPEVTQFKLMINDTYISGTPANNHFEQETFTHGSDWFSDVIEFDLYDYLLKDEYGEIKMGESNKLAFYRKFTHPDDATNGVCIFNLNVCTYLFVLED